MKIEYLCSVHGMSETEILEFLNKLNICGKIFVLNQQAKIDRSYELVTEKYQATIFDSTEKGVSKSRNKLMDISKADYITFIDNDMSFIGSSLPEIEDIIFKKKEKCIRFNITSENQERKTKLLHKEGYVGFNKIKSFGLHGCFFKRTFLIENKIYFDEDIGPGKYINHGEDTIFLKTFLCYSKIYSCKQEIFAISHNKSTWRGENRDIHQEMISHGYVYSILFPKTKRIRLFSFIFLHKNTFPASYTIIQLYKWAVIGVKKYKEEKVGINLDV